MKEIEMGSAAVKVNNGKGSIWTSPQDNVSKKLTRFIRPVHNNVIYPFLPFGINFRFHKSHPKYSQGHEKNTF